MCCGERLSERPKRNMKFSLKNSWFPIALFVLFCISRPSAVNAASLYFSPSSGSFSVGNIFTTSIFVNTQGEVINNTDAVINFPNELLDVVSINKSGSIFSLWVEEPSFSNSAGTISFNGGLPTPGYNGTAGKIVNVVFKAKSAGAASVLFSSAAVRANDGLGTDVLQAQGQAQFTLGAVKAPPETPPVKTPPAETPPTANTPSAPTISSVTHPSQTAWYSNADPSFNWSNGTDTTAVNVLADRKPTTNPGTNPDGLFSTYRYDSVDEGTWYFHVRLKNSKGWGDVSHFKFQIDTEKPDRFAISQLDNDTSGKLKFLFDASDKTSGIDHFEVSLDGGEMQSWRPVTPDAPFELAPPSAGKHTMVVRAMDKAGNSISNTIDFVTEAVSAVPVITQYPKQIVLGAIPTIGGTSAPDQQIIIWVQKQGGQEAPYMTKTDKKGLFSRTIEEPLAAGKYKVWAQAVSDNGLKSPLSEKVTMVVGDGCSLAGNWLVWGFGGLSAVLFVIIIILLIWITRLRRKINKPKRSIYGMGSFKDAAQSAAILARRRAPVRKKKIIRPIINTKI